MDLPKVYRATARLDATSPGFDSEGPLEPVPVSDPPSPAAVQAVLAGFTGTIQQVPPGHSAVKVHGRSAYKLARAGRPPELAPRPVQVYWTHLWSYAWPLLDFEVACGRGTYIRALIRDIGVALHTGGYLTGLVRSAVGPFQTEQSWTFARLEALPDPAAALLPLDQLATLLATLLSAPVQVPAPPI
jgi:tRNA pseudouridine55 synthase